MYSGCGIVGELIPAVLTYTKSKNKVRKTTKVPIHQVGKAGEYRVRIGHKSAKIGRKATLCDFGGYFLAKVGSI